MPARLNYLYSTIISLAGNNPIPVADLRVVQLARRLPNGGGGVASVARRDAENAADDPSRLPGTQQQ